MTPYAPVKRKQHANVFKALAHHSRLLIVETLAGGERCVCELTELVGADMSTVSRHLSVLRNAGLIEDDKRGLQVFYRLRCPCVLDFLRCVESISSERDRGVCAADKKAGQRKRACSCAATGAVTSS